MYIVELKHCSSKHNQLRGNCNLDKSAFQFHSSFFLGDKTSRFIFLSLPCLFRLHRFNRLVQSCLWPGLECWGFFSKKQIWITWRIVCKWKQKWRWQLRGPRCQDQSGSGIAKATSIAFNNIVHLVHSPPHAWAGESTDGAGVGEEQDARVHNQDCSAHWRDEGGKEAWYLHINEMVE